MPSADRHRLAWIVPAIDAGGIGPFALDVATAVAATGSADVTLIETHASPRRDIRQDGGVRRVALDMGGTRASASVVIHWLRDNPQTLIFTNDVSHLQEIFPHIPADTLHVAVLHDAARRYRDHVASYARYLDGVAAVSDHVYELARKDLQTIGFFGIVRRIHNGTVYPPPLMRNASAPPLRLLFIGDMWIKGGDRLPAIAKALRRRGIDFRLTIVGEGTAQVRRRFAGAGLAEMVAWVDRLPRDELWRTYAAHDVLLMLSWGEAFGMVTIEAMGMGCVPIAYDVPSGSRDIIESGVSGFLVPPNSEAVAAAIAGISPERLALMALEAVRRTRAFFSATRAAQDYIRLVDDLVRCRSLIIRSRLPVTAISHAVQSPCQSLVANLYRALPPAMRSRIRHGLAAYPAGARWIRERF